jgi:hypothetical protein
MGPGTRELEFPLEECSSPTSKVVGLGSRSGSERECWSELEQEWQAALEDRFSRERERWKPNENKRVLAFPREWLGPRGCSKGFLRALEESWLQENACWRPFQTLSESQSVLAFLKEWLGPKRCSKGFLRASRAGWELAFLER